MLVITPWNFPISLAMIALGDVIASGNCAIIKPSEVAPESALIIQKIVHEYLDTDCYQVILGAISETTALLSLKFDHILYTGNGAVGRIVMKAAAEHLTPVTLELGGKSPAFIDKSCNIKVAARRMLFGKYVNNGQICMCKFHKNIYFKITSKT